LKAIIKCALAALLFAVAGADRASAWIYVNTNTPDGSCVVTLSGVMTLVDANFFEAMADMCNGGGVLLESRGGSLDAGLRIGEIVRRRGMETAVAYDAMCASSCALAWLGGVVRNMFPTSRIGFHEAYVLEGDSPRTSSVGNALIGVYLTNIGVPREAVIFITSADDHSLNWLDYRGVHNLGIGIKLLTVDDYGWIDKIRRDDPHYGQ